jgi:hypothetical protein
MSFLQVTPHLGFEEKLMMHSKSNTRHTHIYVCIYAYICINHNQNIILNTMDK